MNIEFRKLAMIGIGQAVGKTIMLHTSKDPDGITPNCLSCEHFNEPKEICRAANDQRPPARIIALGCNLYRDKDDIPF